MKPLPLALLAVLALVASARSQEEDAPAPIVLPTTARILSDISDGTPPAPQPPKPVFVVPPSDISRHVARRTLLGNPSLRRPFLT